MILESKALFFSSGEQIEDLKKAIWFEIVIIIATVALRPIKCSQISRHAANSASPWEPRTTSADEILKCETDYSVSMGKGAF